MRTRALHKLCVCIHLGVDVNESNIFENYVCVCVCACLYMCVCVSALHLAAAQGEAQMRSVCVVENPTLVPQGWALLEVLLMQLQGGAHSFTERSF